MKYLSLLLFVCVWCTGCSSYQYAMVSSKLNNQPSEGFVTENDTVKIVYAFSGKDGPVKISIYNKLQTPLYVDWNQSALIVNNDRRSYTNKKSLLDAELNETRTPPVNTMTQTSTIQGTITSHETSGFIPPHAWARESQLTLKSDQFELPANSSPTQTERIRGVTVASYLPGQSPLTFRSFITFSTHADFSNPIHVDHEFWVSEITQTKASPRNFPARANQFYIQKMNIAAPFIGLGVVTIAVVTCMAVIFSQAF